MGGVVLVSAFLVVVLAIGPVHNFPVEDDWDYSRMVKIFLETGRLQRSDYAQATLIFPAVYGALVSRVFGFSFTALRLSTLVLALGALLAFYALLGELEFGVPQRVLGALSLLVTPVFIYLSFSFMTDVPTLCWLVLAALFYVRALKRADARPAVFGSASAALAFLTRQIGLFIPLAFAAVVLWRRPRRDWMKYLTAGCALPFAIIIAYALAPGQNSVANWATQNITIGLTVADLLLPTMWGVYIRRAVQTSMTLGFYLTPIFLAFSSSTGIALRALITDPRPRQAGYAAAAGLTGVAIVRLAARGEWFPYLTDIFTRAGLRPYLAYVAWDAGALRSEILPRWVFIFATILAAFAGLGLSFLAIRHARRLWSRSESPAQQFLFLLTLLIAGASLVFATFYERYLLPLLPGAIVLILESTRGARYSFRAAAVSLLVMFVAVWALMQDYWGWNEARWQVGRTLLAQNVPAEKIDGGYEWDGWYLYDATVAYIRTTHQPFIYDPWQYVLDPEYVLAFQPLKNYRVAQVVEFATPFADGKFYLQIRETSSQAAPR